MTDQASRWIGNVFNFRKQPTLALLLGPPRGGTTIVSRCIAQHSGVSAILEPYQARREDQYAEIRLERLCRDFKVKASRRGAVLVKETFTRKENVSYAMALLARQAARGAGTSLIVIYRSPVEAFLSQVSAVEQQWKKKVPFGLDTASASAFLRTFVLNFLRVHELSPVVPRTFVTYDEFCTKPERVLKRIMAVIGLPFEDGQLDLAAGGEQKITGGDPGAHRRGAIEKRSRQEQTALFEATLGTSVPGARMLRLQENMLARQADLSVNEAALWQYLLRELQGIKEELYATVS